MNAFRSLIPVLALSLWIGGAMTADDLLHRFRQAPAAEKGCLRAQLDATSAPAELEFSRGC